MFFLSSMTIHAAYVLAIVTLRVGTSFAPEGCWGRSPSHHFHGDAIPITQEMQKLALFSTQASRRH
jgi:hypothetical protein